MKKRIGIVSLNPYSPSEVLLVTCGMSQDEIWHYVEESKVLPEDATQIEREWYDDSHRRWELLVKGEDVAESLERVLHPSNYTKGVLCYDSITKNGNRDLTMIMILDPYFDTTDTESMITLSHECLHVCQSFLPTYLDRDEEQEAEAYFHSYLMREVLEIIK